MEYDVTMPEDVSLRALKLDVDGWRLIEESEDKLKLAHVHFHDILTLFFFDQTPDLPSIQSINKLRKHYLKELKTQKGAIIDINTTILDGCDAIKTIFKFPDEHDEGPIYLGAFTIPFADFGFVIKIQSFSDKNWKLRERFVQGKVMNEYPKEESDQILKDWYLNSFGEINGKGGARFNYSEREEFDDFFPDHPLTRLRVHMNVVNNHLQIGDQVKEAPPFKEKNNIKSSFLRRFMGSH